MRYAVPLLFLATLAMASPVLAEDGPGDGRVAQYQQRGEGRGGRDGGGDRGNRGDRGGDRGDRGEGRRDFGGDDNNNNGNRGRSPNSLGEGWREQQDEARSGVREGRMVPLGSVLSDIRRRQPGRQLDAGIEQQGGRPTYRVRWAAENGRRMDFIVDARTGAILSVEGR